MKQLKLLLLISLISGLFGCSSSQTKPSPPPPPSLSLPPDCTALDTSFAVKRDFINFESLSDEMLIRVLTAGYAEVLMREFAARQDYLKCRDGFERRIQEYNSKLKTYLEEVNQ